jgi:hypothetical protein
MQIGLLNQLNFPSGSKQPLAGNTDDSKTDAAPGAATRARSLVVPQDTPAQDAAGVVLKIQSDPTGGAGVALPVDLVYSNGRKSASDSDADSDTARMAVQHSQALQRSNGSSTQLALDKDGVLVAKPASPSAKAPDFVSFAVSAMRDYADEQERLKSASPAADSASTASLIPRGLAEVQKLAARFKLFA